MNKKLVLLAVCLFSIAALAQPAPPDCSKGFCAGIGSPMSPHIACKAGYKYSQLDAPGTSWSCTGIPPDWVQDSGGGGSAQAAAVGVVQLATSCSSSNTNCFKVNADAQVAQTATYTVNSNTGGATATLLTTNSNGVSGEYLNNVASSAFGSYITESLSANYTTYASAFKIASTASVLGCWGTNTGSSSSVPSVTIAVSPVGGAGHVLYAVAAGVSFSTAVTFTGGGNTWVNTSNPLNNLTIQTGNAYAANAVGGSYTVTATFNGNVQFGSAAVCEISGLATSNVLDATSSYTGQSSATHYASGLSTTANDLVMLFDVPNSASTPAAGKIGTTSQVATGSSDPAFAPSDVGKKFLATTNCDALNGYIDCTQSFPAGTITSFVDAHHVTVSSTPVLTNATTSQAFTGWFIWGHDDVAQVTSAFAAAASQPGFTLALPCGSMLVGAPPFLSTAFGGNYNPNIAGCSGQNGSVLIPTADYNYALASGGIFFSYPYTNYSGYSAITFQNPYISTKLSNFTVWGGGIDGSNVTIPLPIFNASLVNFDNVWIVGWNWNPNVGVNNMPGIAGTSLNLISSGIWSAGNGGLKITGDQYGYPNSAYNSKFGVQNSATPAANQGCGLQMTSGNFTSEATQFYPANANSGAPTGSAVAYAGACVTGGTWYSRGDAIGQLKISGGNVQLVGSADAVLMRYGIYMTGGSVRAQDSQIDVLNITAGTFNDLGGNYACDNPTWYPCDLTAPEAHMHPWMANTHALNSFTGGAVKSANLSDYPFAAAGTPLPTCSAVWTGTQALVTDATTPTFNGTYVSGGAVQANVRCNGSNWVTY